MMQARLGGGNDLDRINPSKNVFYAGRLAKPFGNRRWRGGVNSNPENWGLYDRWGSPYRVSLDSNFEDKVREPGGGADFKETAIVWSAGPDREFETWADNLKSWRNRTDSTGF